MANTGQGNDPVVGGVIISTTNNAGALGSYPNGGKTVWNRGIVNYTSPLHDILQNYFFEESPPPSGGTYINRALLGVG